jgi:hypothetical protein
MKGMKVIAGLATVAGFAAHAATEPDLVDVPDGRLLLGGHFRSDYKGQSFPTPRIRRIHANGADDPAFSAPSSPYSCYESASRLAVQPDGKIAVAKYRNRFLP